MEEKKILIVDDEAPIRKLFHTALKQKGYAVSSASSAEQALELMKNDLFPVMFLDLNLPNMSGIELCQSVLKTHPETIAYAVTGYTSSYKSDECILAGFKAYFTKPISLQTLFEAAEEAFKKK